MLPKSFFFRIQNQFPKGTDWRMTPELLPMTPDGPPITQPTTRGPKYLKPEGASLQPHYRRKVADFTWSNVNVTLTVRLTEEPKKKMKSKGQLRPLIIKRQKRFTVKLR